MQQAVSHHQPPRRLDASPLGAAIRAHAQARGLSLRRLLGNNSAPHRAYKLANATGTVTAKAAARLCEVIGANPAALWGAAWEQATRPLYSYDTHSGLPLPLEPLQTAIASAARRRQQSETALLGGERSAERRLLDRARQTGTLTLRAAERLCDHLELHPREVWGDLYDSQALAGLPADYDPWTEVA